MINLLPNQIFSLPKDQLIELILSGGLAESVEDFIDQQDKMLKAINESISVVDPTWTPLFIQTEVEAIRALTVQNVFDDIVVPAWRRMLRIHSSRWLSILLLPLLFLISL